MSDADAEVDLPEAPEPPAEATKAEVPDVPTQLDYDRLVVSQGLAQVRERIAIETINWHLAKTGIATQYVDQATGQKHNFHPGQMAKGLLNLIRQEELMAGFLADGLPRPGDGDVEEATQLVVPDRTVLSRGEAAAIKAVLDPQGSPPDRAG